MDSLKKLLKKIKVRIPALWEGEDEPNMYGYELIDTPRPAQLGTEQEMQQAITRTVNEMEDAGEILEGGDTVAGVRGQSKYRRSSWQD